MMTSRLIIVWLIVALVGACDSQKSREEEKMILDKTREEIVALSISAPCTPESTCLWIGLGSKPCGGPWSYLVYPSSIDTVLLLKKVSTYNAAESAYNAKWSVMSDCSVANPPDSVSCVDGKCTGYPN